MCSGTLYNWMDTKVGLFRVSAPLVSSSHPVIHHFWFHPFPFMFSIGFILGLISPLLMQLCYSLVPSNWWALDSAINLADCLLAAALSFSS